MKARIHRSLSTPGMLNLLDEAFREVELSLREASCRHSTRDCLMFASAMFKLKAPSLAAFEQTLKQDTAESGNLQRLFDLTRIPSDETVRRRLGMIEPRTWIRALHSRWHGLLGYRRMHDVLWLASTWRSDWFEGS